MDKLNVNAWFGATVEEAGTVTAAMADQIHATLGVGPVPVPGDLLPPLWHWCAFPNAVALDALGQDGHPRSSDLLPPIRLMRRMWAGGSLEFCAPLRVGDEMRKRSTVRTIVEKEGATGPMVLVTVDHVITGPSGVAIREQQDIVYLDIPQAYCPPKARPIPAEPVETVDPTAALLFRYSALTFNAHRIHYDRAYAQEAEKYPDLVVHGPLQATLLMRAAVRAKGQLPSMFSFRGVHPVFANVPMSIAMEEDDAGLALWTGQDGHQGMQAHATWIDTQ